MISLCSNPWLSINCSPDELPLFERLIYNSLLSGVGVGVDAGVGVGTGVAIGAGVGVTVGVAAGVSIGLGVGVKVVVGIEV